MNEKIENNNMAKVTVVGKQPEPTWTINSTYNYETCNKDNPNTLGITGIKRSSKTLTVTLFGLTFTCPAEIMNQLKD